MNFVIILIIHYAGVRIKFNRRVYTEKSVVDLALKTTIVLGYIKH